MPSCNIKPATLGRNKKTVYPLMFRGQSQEQVWILVPIQVLVLVQMLVPEQVLALVQMLVPELKR